MTDEEFRVLMDLMMVLDGEWPLSHKAQVTMYDSINREARNRHYSDWIDAYHRHQPMEVA